MRNLYEAEFHDALWEGSVNAARLLLPDLFALWRPANLIDVGCGPGAYLSVAAEAGIESLCGVDLPSSREGHIHFEGMRFVPADLMQPLPALDGPFDMAMSIEAAEHLPESAARRFVTDLAGLADVMLFSAAIPGQGGVGHINEQWPSYWTGLFAEHGFEPREVCRPRFWTDPDAPSALRTNVLLFVRPPAPDALASLPIPLMLDVIPPEFWQEKLRAERTLAWRAARKVNAVARRLPGSGRRAGRPVA